MSNQQTALGDDAPLETRDQLVGVFAHGEKPASDWRIGTEHEKFVYRLSDHGAPSYDEPNGIRDLLKGMETYGWEPVAEGDNVIALKGPDGAISLEPAGQFELSGAPVDDDPRAPAPNRTATSCSAAKSASGSGLGFLGLGFWPDKRRDELPVMPKGRYAIMLRHMPKVGGLGLDMMKRTCTIQTNLDYASEADMREEVQGQYGAPAAGDRAVRQFAVHRGQAERVPQSFRSAHLDRHRPAPHRHAAVRVRRRFRLRPLRRLRARCADVLRLPRRRRISTRRASASATFSPGGSTPLYGEKPTVADWKDHLSTAFPEVRLKGYLEMRGADGGRWDRICALPALYGSGYSTTATALDAAWDLCKGWTHADHARLREEVPSDGVESGEPERWDPAGPCQGGPQDCRRRASRRARGSTGRATVSRGFSRRCTRSPRAA